MHRQVKRSLAYGAIGFAGMGLLWYLDSIKSWLIFPAFFAFIGFLLVFNPIVGNFRYLKERLDNSNPSDKKNADP